MNFQKPTTIKGKTIVKATIYTILHTLSLPLTAVYLAVIMPSELHANEIADRYLDIEDPYEVSWGKLIFLYMLRVISWILMPVFVVYLFVKMEAYSFLFPLYKAEQMIRREENRKIMNCY